jgi:hypothetical protein
VLFDNALNSAETVQLGLTAGEVLGFATAPAGSQPSLSIDEQVECEQADIASPEFRDALQPGTVDWELNQSKLRKQERAEDRQFLGFRPGTRQ